jgi:hypothetical protein
VSFGLLRQIGRKTLYVQAGAGLPGTWFFRHEAPNKSCLLILTVTLYRPITYTRLDLLLR